MLLANAIVAASGGAIAFVLLVLGFVVGIRVGKRNSEDEDGLKQQDRQRMLELLHELGDWTSEYSGNVSQYHVKLGELTKAVTQENSAAQAETRIVNLLRQIMESNEELQSRLDAAEKQLDKQTKQIESYLTEARTDGLTGLFNRRAFDQRLDELFAAYRKGGRSFVLVLIDVDHFKSINDNHGHQVGDVVLQQLSRALKTEMERAAIVARYGGEEFVVITDGPLRIAAARMNEFRKMIEHLEIDTTGGVMRITISVGLSEPRDDVVVGPIVRRADEALYAAKNIGRNRVYYHDGRSPTVVGAPEVAREKETS